MAWIYLAESEGSQSPWHLGFCQSPTVRTIDTLPPCCWIEWLTGRYLWHRFGTMYAHCKETICHRSIWSTVASPVRTSALQELERAWKESEADYFSRSCGLPMKYDQDSSSWKTCQQSQSEVLRICVTDMNYVLKAIKQGKGKFETEEELEKLAQRLSLWLLTNESLKEQ